jgi:hypothetical protein
MLHIEVRSGASMSSSGEPTDHQMLVPINPKMTFEDAFVGEDYKM